MILGIFSVENGKVNTKKWEPYVTYTDGKITNLEAKVVSLTSERDQWKQLANNWYAVAMEQLNVMINVLGL